MPVFMDAKVVVSLNRFSVPTMFVFVERDMGR